MAWNTNLKLFLSFSSINIIDEVDGGVFSAVGDQNIEIDSVRGMQMKRSQSISGSTDLDIPGTGLASVAFWLYSTNPGLARNPSTGDLEPIQMPIFDVFVDGVDFVMLAYEETQLSGNNVLVFKAWDSSEVEYTVTSSEYTVDRWHHFTLIVDGSGSATMTIVIDGLTDISTGGLLADLNTGSSYTTSINRYAPGNIYQKIGNTGIIDDFLFFNTNLATTAIAELIYAGPEFVYDTQYADDHEIYLPLIYDDPYAVTTSAFISDGVQLHATRSDGLLLSGERILWQRRLRFDGQNIDENDLPKDISINGAGVVFGNNSIKITDGIISLHK